MDLITLLFTVLVFALVVWGGFWIIAHSGFPPPVTWIWGALCLIVLVYFLLGQATGLAFLHRPLWHQ